MLLENTGEVQHRVPRGVESSQQLVDHDDDFGLFTVLETTDDVLVVLLVTPVPSHHFLPELLDDGKLRFVDFHLFIAFAVVGGGDQHLRGDHAELVEVLLVQQGSGLVLGH